MYNNPYMPTAYNQQQNIDRINSQINDLEKLRNQMQQPPQQPTNLTQNFQLAPTSRDIIRYAGSIEEVQRDMVIGDTPYFSKDMSVVWIKNIKGEIKSYELNEILPKDEKDMQIEMLQTQIEDLRKEMNRYEQSFTNVIEPKNAANTEKDDEPTREPIEESKPASVSRVSTSKKK